MTKEEINALIKTHVDGQGDQVDIGAALPKILNGIIDLIPEGGGGSGVAASDVNLRDYDGTIVASYTAEEFAALTELPTPPAHEGLTFQGWNWSLIKAKEFVAKYGKLNIGATYVSSDGVTRITILLTEGYTSPTLVLALSGTCIVDWGDGSEQDTMTGTGSEVSISHNYNATGSYVISITPSNDSLITLTGSEDSATINWIHWDRSALYYQSAVREVVIGRGVEIGSFAFRNCYSLKSVVIPDSVTSIGDNAFQDCYGLKSVVILDGVTSIRDYLFQSCYSLTSVVIPDSVTSIGDSAFQNCYSLTSVVIPDSVTSIGDNAFLDCYGLTSVVIPDSVTSIGVSAFQDCYSLTSVVIPDSVTSIRDYLFQSCYSLKSVVIPDSVTSIGGSAFLNCYGLKSVVIPDSVTSIGVSAFQDCYSLTSVVIPDSVTSIGDNAFLDCYGLTSVVIPDSVTSIGGGAFLNAVIVRIYAITPPSMSYAFAYPFEGVIYVPAESVDTYKAAQGWSDYASQIQALPTD